MKKLAIIGVGDVLRGDHGAACYVLEAVADKTGGENIQFSYMGSDPRSAGGLLYAADLAIIVGTMRLSGVPGGLHVWNGQVFQQHAGWMAAEDPAFRHLLDALARADLAGGFPEKLLFIWIEPQLAEGYEISKPVREAIRLAARRITYELHQQGLRAGINGWDFKIESPTGAYNYNRTHTLRGVAMDFSEKARIRIEHWMKHTADHLKEYEMFADELEGAGSADSARHIREMAVLTARTTECLDSALLTLNKTE